jgi:Tfp pilus assembly protein PilP
MRRLLVTIVALVLAPAILRGQTPAASPTKSAAAAPPQPSAAKPAPAQPQPAAVPAKATTTAPQPAAAAQKPAATTPQPAQPAAKAAATAPPQPAPPAAPVAKPGASTPTTTPAQPPASATPPQPEAFTYNPDGRRDPFTNLIGSGGGDTRPAAGRRGDGAAGLSVGEISVRGVVQSPSGLIAMVQGPDNKTYIVHQGDRLLDGSIKSITTQGLVCIQEVNDPLSLVKQREVSKLLRSLEGVK